jgi:hypothetical protein
MPAAAFDLAKILDPVVPEAFFHDTWEKQPLAVSRNDPAFYAGLFTLGDVDAVLAFTRPKFVGSGESALGEASGSNVVEGWLPDDEPLSGTLFPDIGQVHQAFARGKTVILKAMQHRWPAVAALCRNLEGFFSCPVHTNLYLTPKGAQGFAAHYDTHEVFVLQIEGSKHWRFYGPARDLPLEDEKAVLGRDELPAPTQEVTVHAGDLLYMPRGHVHEAFTSDCLSLHLTVGVRIFRWADVLVHALAGVCARDVRFRASLPPGLLTGAQVPPAAQAQFQELLRVFADSAWVEEGIGRLASSFLHKLAGLPGDYFRAAEAAEHLDLDTVLERAPGVFCRVVPGRGWVSLEYPGNRLDGPAKIASALQFIARTPRFAVRALPDDLTAEAKLVLARRLVRERCLTVVPPPAPPGLDR